MSRRSLATLAASAPLAVALAAASVAPALGSAKAASLRGTVGPGFSISLKDSSGKAVKTLKAGTYAFTIADKASIHNFTLEQEKGGKFEKDLTSVSFTGTKTVTVKLTKGKWKYYCTPHQATMFGFFRVT